MISDINLRVKGKAGRITLQRPKALNAMTYEMCLAIEKTLIEWKQDSKVELIIIDAQGDKAFCSGGDISDLYEEGSKKNYNYGKKFWDDEYRLNALIAKYPKPYIAFMQGFTMGGGVGISCHGSHRIVCETSKIAMPECSIGLIPDVGGSLLLARAPSNLGYYLGITGTHMNAADAISYLEDVIAEKKAIPYTRRTRRGRGGNTMAGHRKGKMGPGKYPRKASKVFIKLINSAMDNARQRYDTIEPDEMIITHLASHRGQIHRGWRPRAQGRATPDNHYQVNIEIFLEHFGEEEEEDEF